MVPTSSPVRSREGLLLVGHGTQAAEGMREFHQLLALVQQRLPAVDVLPGFVELAEPTIVEGVVQLASRGARHVVVTPLLLFAAGHAKRDLPRAVAAARRAAGLSTLTQARHLGCHPRLVALSRQRFDESLAARSVDADSQTVLIMVGRGSCDAEAVREMHQLTTQRQAHHPQIPARTAFLAMAQPALDEVIADVLQLPVDRVVVQPHLLFQGALLAQLRQRVAELNTTQTRQRWCLTEHLGPSPLLAAAVIDRFWQALARAARPSSESLLR